MKYTTFIFDLDGTLLDTLTDLSNSVNYVLKKRNLPTKTIDEIRSYLGNGMEKLIEKSVLGGKSNPNFYEILEEFKKYYFIHANDSTKPYDYILDILKYLKENNYKTAIVSNKGDFAVKKLHELYFKDYIDVAIGETKEIKRKPAPDTVNKALELLNSTKEEAFYIGDSEVDIDTAINAKMECLVVSWGFRDYEELIKYNPKYIFKDQLSFYNFIKSLTK